MTLNWHFTDFSSLKPEGLYDILSLRSMVFIVEQKCLYQDIDSKDQVAYHLTGRNEQGKLIAYSRIFEPGTYYAEASIGRVVIHPECRRFGLGRKLMEKSVTFCSLHFRASTIKIGAQLYLKKFYESLGFQEAGEIYIEDEIKHIPMHLSINQNYADHH